MERPLDPPEPKIRCLCYTCMAACPENVEFEPLGRNEFCDICGDIRCQDCDNTFNPENEGGRMDGRWFCSECLSSQD